MKQNQPLPATIRLATENDAADIARVQVDSWHTTYQGLISEEYLHSLTYERHYIRWKRTLGQQNGSTFTYVALNSQGQIVGFASGGPEREGKAVYRGELYAIYLLASAQRQGIGRQLLLATAHHLAQQGIPSMLVWVLAGNPAQHFYEAMGGKYIRMKMEAVGGEMRKELAYGWKNTDALFS